MVYLGIIEQVFLIKGLFGRRTRIIRISKKYERSKRLVMLRRKGTMMVVILSHVNEKSQTSEFSILVSLTIFVRIGSGLLFIKASKVKPY